MNTNDPLSPLMDSQVNRDCYLRAQAFMQGYDTQNLIQNDNIKPVWINDSDCFWYTRTYKSESGQAGRIGKEYRMVDADKRCNSLAFDHSDLAKSLTIASKKTTLPQELPLSDIVFSLDTSIVSFTAYDYRWRYDAEKKTCTAVQTELAVPVIESLSPDGKHVAFVHDHNLWLREVSSGNERPLTSDGEAFYRYAGKPTAVGFTDDDEVLDTPNLCWSPNSKRVFTVQRDSRKVLAHPIVNYVPKNGSFRPTVDHI